MFSVECRYLIVLKNFLYFICNSYISMFYKTSALYFI
jgi:hypothetical protein